MPTKILILILAVLSVSLSACATRSLNAPCNHYATFCGTKTKINS